MAPKCVAFALSVALFFSQIVVPIISDPHTVMFTPILRRISPEKDPLGNDDVFDSLSEKDKLILSRSAEIGLNSKRKLLNTLETFSSVQIRLVGFEGDGNLHVKLDETELMKYLNLLKTSEYVPVIHGENHKLPFQNRYFFRVTHAPTFVETEINSSIEKSINGSSNRNPDSKNPHRVPYLTVDRIIASDFERHTANEYTIYILNPRSQSAPYVYSYDDPRDCPGTFFVGKKRYLWLDLTAGPVSYGPTEAGEDVITNSSFIDLSQSTVSHGGYLPQLASLVSSLVTHFLAPSFFHFPLHFALNIQVTFIRITAGGDSTGDDTWGEGGVPGEPFDLQRIEEELVGDSPSDSLAFPQQTVTLKSFSLSMEKCSFCSLVYARALRSGGVDSSGRVRAPAIDSVEANTLLQQYWQDIKSLAGVEDPAFMHPSVVTPGLVIPVFVFDLSTEQPILLDAKHQAVAFDNMVVAVRSRGRALPSKFQCQGQVAAVDLSDVTRPVLASLLQTGWGITPPQLSFSEVHGQALTEHRWSVGPSPFGPLSSSLNVSFAHRDAARRNLVMTLLNQTVTDVLHTLDIVQSYGGEDMILKASQNKGRYSQRWNVLRYKLLKCVEAVAAGRSEEGLFYVRSARHDAGALFEVVVEASRRIQTRLECYKSDPKEWLWYIFLVTGGISAAGVWFNREQLFRSKLKRF